MLFMQLRGLDCGSGLQPRYKMPRLAGDELS
jgi:hypothetical protein